MGLLAGFGGDISGDRAERFRRRVKRTSHNSWCSAVAIRAYFRFKRNASQQWDASKVFKPLAAALRSAKVSIASSATATPLGVTVKGTGVP